MVLVGKTFKDFGIKLDIINALLGLEKFILKTFNRFYHN